MRSFTVVKRVGFLVIIYKWSATTLSKKRTVANKYWSLQQLKLSSQRSLNKPLLEESAGFSLPTVWSRSKYYKNFTFYAHLIICTYLNGHMTSFLKINSSFTARGVEVLRISSDGADGRICCLVWNFRFRDFFGLENLASIFLGGLIFGVFALFCGCFNC